ncbi:MAG: DEAD/DEAH box helicase [Candidatus Thermoplasmatota archaeon]|nr:DEAD/DEAH box helicase [Candidatus Thermoplasmatota archaeon]
MTPLEDKDSDHIVGLEDLSPRVAAHMKRKGIKEATGPQKVAIGPISEGLDVLLIAPTGLGKTEATFAPLMDRLKEDPPDGIGILYIAPIRALNRDIWGRIKSWCDELGLTIGVRHSDTSQSDRTRMSRKPPHILVTTPETLQIMFTGKRLRKGLETVSAVIVDEIHELYGSERGAQLDLALSRLDRAAGRKVQRIGLSATISNAKDVASFLGGPGREVTVIKGQWSKEYSFLVESPSVLDEDKEMGKSLGCTPKVAAVVRRIRELLEDIRSALIFVNSRDLAEALTARLKAYDGSVPVGIHHGSLSKEAREDMESRFKKGELRAMVCTSSMELGMDIGVVDLVIQFKSPKEVSRLLQRAGRAGHQVGGLSRCVILATETDDVVEAGVIAHLAKGGKLEKVWARKMILSVLANQTLSILVAEKDLSVDDLTDIASRTYTFSGIAKEEVVEVLRFLNDSRVIFFDEEGGMIHGGKRSREYFYENISMIPDERVILIRDLSTRSIIGSLDMDFVLSNLEPYSRFIVRGQAWRVVDMGDEEITVEPVTELGPVPAWSGSDIPVPYEVAREVAVVRKEVVRWLKGDAKRARALDRLPLSEEAREMVISQLREMVEEGFVVPDQDTATIEIGTEGAMIGICGGTRVNETIGRMVASLMMARYGGTVIVDHDAYRILLMGDLRLKAPDIEWAMKQVPVSDMENMVPVLLRNSPLLRWQMLHVAKKFGVLGSKIDPAKFPLKRLMAIWRDTIIMREATAKIMHERLDIPHSTRSVSDIIEGRTELKVQRISPLSMSGSRARSEFMSSEGAGKMVIETVKERLMTTSVRLTCMNCGSTLRATAERAKDIVGCHRCGSRMLAPLPTGDLQTRAAVEKGLQKKRLTGDDRKRFKAAAMAAQLFSSYGYRAVLCMAARGVGPKTAGRILEVLYDDDEELVRRIFQDEVKFARTRRFWD